MTDSTRYNKEISSKAYIALSSFNSMEDIKLELCAEFIGWQRKKLLEVLATSQGEQLEVEFHRWLEHSTIVAMNVLNVFEEVLVIKQRIERGRE